MKLLMALITIALSLSSVGADGGVTPKHHSRVRNLCEVVNNWKEYNQRKVRVRAILGSGPEQTWLYDPACKNGEALTYVGFRQHVKGTIKRLDRILAKGMQAEVILEGVFYGPELYKNVDPKLPASIRERLGKSPRRYGHMDSFGTMLNVTKIISAAEIPSSRVGKSSGRRPR
jgi:hypothetical protein